MSKKLFLIFLFVIPGLKAQDKIDLLSLGNLKEDKIIATIGSRKITVKEFLYGYEFGPAFPKRVKNSKDVYLNYLINEKLIAEDALKNKIDTSEGVKSNLKAIESDIASEVMFKDKVLPKVNLSKQEIDNGYLQKKTKYNVQWLFAPTPDSLLRIARSFKEGSSFDSLYKNQFGDSVLLDERSMSGDMLKLREKNPEIYKVIDTLKQGEESGPVQGQDGWYIFKLENRYREASLSTVPEKDILDEVKSALTKMKMDTLSAVFVDSVIASSKPVIKGEAFVILRAYLGRFFVDETKAKEWRLKERSDSVLIKQPAGTYSGSLTLVSMQKGKYTIDDFIQWFRLRSDYIKIDQRSYNNYSASIESLIWRMVRDNRLTELTYTNGYNKNPVIKDELQWWKDKIAFAVTKEDIINSVMLKDNKETLDDNMKMEVTKKLLSKINSLKKKYKVTINHDLLNQIKVENENDPKAIETYAVKKGGIFPRPAYPSIDFMWESWQ